MGMRRGQARIFAGLLAIVLPLLMLGLQGCSKKECYRLAVLQWSEKVPAYQNAFDGFMNALRGKGYIEGVNLKVRRFLCNQERERARELTDDLASWNPNLFLALGTPATLEAKAVLQKKYPGIPLLFTATTSPDRTGIISSYTPQKNMAGVGVEIAASERVETIRETFPWAKQVGIVYFPDTQPALLTSKEVTKALRILGMEPVDVVLSSSRKSESLKEIDEMAKRVDILYFSPDPILYASSFLDKALKIAIKNKVPVVGITKSIAAKGAVMAEYVDYYEAGEEAADMAYKILSGLSPKKLLSHPINSRHIAVNLSVARQLNLAIPRTILLRADKIIDSPGSV